MVAQNSVNKKPSERGKEIMQGFRWTRMMANVEGEGAGHSGLGPLDWDLWLGPAPYRPYHPAYAPTFWRGWWDFGTGGLGDMACHNMDPVMNALKLGPPTTFEASFSIYVGEFTWDKKITFESYPQASIVRYQFPAREGMPPVSVT